jgi:hypothetical protein
VVSILVAEPMPDLISLAARPNSLAARARASSRASSRVSSVGVSCGFGFVLEGLDTAVTVMFGFFLAGALVTSSDSTGVFGGVTTGSGSLVG